MNRALPPGDCGDREADPGRASGRTRPVPGTVGLVGRSENPPKRATLPSQYPAARGGRKRRDLSLDAEAPYLPSALVDSPVRPISCYGTDERRNGSLA